MIKWFWNSGEGIICLAVLAIILAMYGASILGTSNRKALQEWRDWSHKCIESGGAPVTLNAYLKGIGEGEMCVKISEKIEVYTK